MICPIAPDGGESEMTEPTKSEIEDAARTYFGTDEETGIFHALGGHMLPVPMEDGVGLLFCFEF